MEGGGGGSSSSASFVEAAPDSWELEDLDESMSRLMVSSNKKSTASSSSEPDLINDLNNRASSGVGSGSVAGLLSSSASAPSLVGVEKNGRGGGGRGGISSDDVINQVDQFLREA